MALTLLLGGARSGKSALAVRLAGAAGRPVVFIATARAEDEEMADRIARHRAERPSSWSTVEAAVELERAIRRAPDEACVVVDCLTLWLSNIWERPDDEVIGLAVGASRAAATRSAQTIAVSNEIGSGVVPADARTRRFRDLLGRVNAVWAERAETALLVIAGRALVLEPPERLLRD